MRVRVETGQEGWEKERKGVEGGNQFIQRCSFPCLHGLKRISVIGDTVECVSVRPSNCPSRTK